MKKILIGLLAVMLSGCITMPSFYDDNESLLAVDVRMAVSNIDCEHYDAQMISNVQHNVRRFAHYSESKGSADIGEMILTMQSTVDGIAKKENVSAAYCKIKKKILIKQSSDIATAVMGRY